MAFGQNHTADVKGISLYICKAADKVWHDGVAFKVGLSTSKNMSFVCFNERPLKNDEKCFIFHFKRSFRFQDIYIFLGTFRSCRKTA